MNTTEQSGAPKARTMNVPNTLSLIRVVMVPLFIASLLYLQHLPVWGRVIPTLVFLLTAFTDMLDGKIARKYNLITDFGKFLDPMADKFMVFGALIGILVVDREIAPLFVWVAAVVMLRELAVTSLRLVAAGKSGQVIAASWWGKIKTVTQVVSIVLLLMEPVIWGDFAGAVYTALPHLPAWFAMLAMLITTVGSGIDYFRAYWPVLDFQK